MVILVVDGYNIIGAWSELQRLKEIDIGQARDRLIEMMAEYGDYEISGYYRFSCMLRERNREKRKTVQYRSYFHKRKGNRR